MMMLQGITCKMNRLTKLEGIKLKHVQFDYYHTTANHFDNRKFSNTNITSLHFTLKILNSKTWYSINHNN